MKRLYKGFGISVLVILVISCFFAKSEAYHIWITENSSQRAHWDPSVFLVDNTTVTFPGGRAGSDGVAQPSAPNNNKTGLLWDVDRIVSWSATTVTCDPLGTADAYGKNGNEPYDTIYDAIGVWSGVSFSTADLQFVCSEADMGMEAVDSSALVSPHLKIFDGTSFVFNGFNEMLLDDTTNLDYINAIFGSLDPNSILGIGIALDPSGNPLPDPSQANPITEATFFINTKLHETFGASATTVLKGTIVHELGHTMGFGHPGTVLNARGVAFNVNGGKLNNGTTSTIPGHIPTMFAIAIDITATSSVLKVDDLALARISYPTLSASTAFGSISGQVLNSNSQPINGASVVAYDGAGNEIGAIIGGNPGLSGNTIGKYKIEMVPPGSYRVILVPLNGSDQSGGIDAASQIDGVFPATAAKFADTYYASSPTTSESGATVITVSANADTPNINFLSVNTNGGGGGGPGGSNGGGGNIIDTSHGGGGCSMGGSSSPLQTVVSLLILFSPLFFIAWKQKRLRSKLR